MPEGEFEEAPLGSKDTTTPPAPAPVSPPNAKNAPSESAPSTDVAAPPPGLSGDSTPESDVRPAPPSEASAAPVATHTEPEPAAMRAEPPSVAAKPEPAPVAKHAALAPPVTDTPLTPADAADLDTRIASLEEQVSRDQAAIQNILSEPAQRMVRASPNVRLPARSPNAFPACRRISRKLREQRARQSGTPMPGPVVALAGGVGAARFLRARSR
jgi:hypothetical protein